MVDTIGTPDVLIVGAGASGAVAANRLADVARGFVREPGGG